MQRKSNCHYLQMLLCFQYIENPKLSTNILLELINEFHKVAGYNINTQKYIAFLKWLSIAYTNNKLSGKKNQEDNSNYNCIQKNKIPKNKLETWTLKTVRRWWKKLKTTQTNEKIDCAHGLEGL